MADSGNSEDLQCPLCLDLFDQPITLCCQHSFCRQCLISTFKNDKSCPMCRSKLSIDVNELQKMTQNPILRSLVEQHQKYGICEGCNKQSKISVCYHCEKRICSDCRTIHKPDLYKDVKEICGRMQLLSTDVIIELGKDSDEKAALLIEKETKIRQLEEEYSQRVSGIDKNSTQLRINVVKFNNNEEKAKIYLNNWMKTSSDIINHFKKDVDSIKNPFVSDDKMNVKCHSSNVEHCNDPKTDSCLTEAASNGRTNNQNISPVIPEPQFAALALGFKPPVRQIGSTDSPVVACNYWANLPVPISDYRPPIMIDLPGDVTQIVATANDIYGVLPHKKLIIRISISDFSIKEMIPIYGAIEPNGLALLPNGVFLVSDYKDNSVVTVTNGRIRLLCNKCENRISLDGPCGISVKDDLIAIADLNNDRILVINHDGQVKNNFGKRHLTNPEAVCITPDNSYCVIDDDGLKKFDKNGNPMSTVPIENKKTSATYDGARSITCDRYGDVLVGNTLSKSIMVFDKNLHFVSEIRKDELAYQSELSLCVLESGHIAIGKCDPYSLLIF